MIKIFIKKTFLFIIPVFIFLIPPCLILKRTGENLTIIDDLLLSDKQYLVGYSYNQSNIGYIKHYVLCNKSKFDIVALGSSRVLQFREEMFNKPFYNAGFSVKGIKDFNRFLNSIPPDKYPKYLIIGLDQWMFNANWDQLNGTKSKKDWWDNYNYYPSFSVIKNVYSDIIAGKYSFKIKKMNNELIKIGLNAIVNNKGIRKDGSRNYGSQIHKLLKHDKTVKDYLYQDTYNRIKQGNMRFQYCEEVNMDAFYELETFLSFCKKNNIYVIAIIPPYANAVYKKMTKTSRYKYLNKIYPTIKPLFNEFNYELYNYPTVQDANSNDKETLDGFHGGELTYTKIIKDILSKHSKLNKVADKEKINNDILHAKNRYIVY
jgi:hypothetical protein